MSVYIVCVSQSFAHLHEQCTDICTPIHLALSYLFEYIYISFCFIFSLKNGSFFLRRPGNSYHFPCAAVSN